MGGQTDRRADGQTDIPWDNRQAQRQAYVSWSNAKALAKNKKKMKKISRTAVGRKSNTRKQNKEKWEKIQNPFTKRKQK